MPRAKNTVSATIANGTALSGAINLGAQTLVAIIIPAAWTAAAISFQASEDGGTTWYDVFDSTGTEVSIASANVVAGRRVTVDPTAYVGLDINKVRSGVTATPVNQGAARALTLVSRKIYALE